MKDCVMCRIGKGELPSFKIHEDENYITFMDIFPPTFDGKITMPAVLVCTKKHLKSNIFEDLNEEEYSKLLSYTRKIARAIQCALTPERVCLVFEGMEIDHVHAKLYPIFKESYPGWLSTKKSPNNENIKASDRLLEDYAAKIKEQLKNE